MTPDEVAAMTDEELRIAAAELDGWERWPEGVTNMDTGENLPAWTKLVEGESMSAIGVHALPDCPNDIAAALELWDGLFPPYEIRYEIRANPPVALVSVWLNGEAYASASIGQGLRRGLAAAIARATTRAFILEMTADEKEVVSEDETA